MRCSLKNNRIGFTFIELLITLSILSVISLVVYSTLNNGLKIWRRVNTFMPEEDYAVFSDKFGRELRNILKFSPIRFFGQRDRLEFASSVEFKDMGSDTVGKIIYAYDPNKEILYKRRLDFSEAYNDREGVPEEVLNGIKSLGFQYYFYDVAKEEYQWLDEWVKEGFPLAVRLEIELVGGSQPGTITRTVSIPVSD